MNRVQITDEQIQAAQSGDSDSMWEIVEAFDPMLKSVIRSAAPGAGSDDVEDLLQEARAVLIQHIRDYDSSSSSAQLSSFVYRAVRRAVAEEHVSMSTALTVDPTTVLRIRRALWEADGDVDKAWRAVSTSPNPKSRIERERFMATLEAIGEVESLDSPVNGGDGSGEASATLAETIPDPDSQVTGSTERRDLARWLMAQIPARQSLALRAFYGVGMTQLPEAQTCADLGVKPAALRRLRSAGLVSARKAATYWDLRDQVRHDALAHAA
ncbi:sigma factor [Streptomyces sp. NPDC005907]|uniref:sigma factor n=1 Tax=Streptomyces sp. NPDC005907 TaxID=3154571 RepID=UPI0033CEFA1F